MIFVKAGPQKSLYIPGPLLTAGDNEIVVVENYLGSQRVSFTPTPNYGPTTAAWEIAVTDPNIPANVWQKFVKHWY